MAITINGRRATPEEAAAKLEKQARKFAKRKKVEDADDDSMGAIFRAHHLAQQKKRTENRDRGTALLREKGIFFTEHNFGAHLIVVDRWDFWPGTDRWKERKGRPGYAKRAGRGAQELINIIKEEESHGIGQ